MAKKKKECPPDQSNPMRPGSNEKVVKLLSADPSLGSP